MMKPPVPCDGYIDPAPFYPKDMGVKEAAWYFRALETDDPKITERMSGIVFTTKIACNLLFHQDMKSTCMIPLDTSKPVVIVCHGYNSWRNQMFILNLAAKLAEELQCHVLRFDFTGNGHSTGDWSGSNYDGELNDLRSVVDFVQNYLNLSIVSIVGHSKATITVNRYLAEESTKAKESGNPISIPCGVSLAGLFMTPETPDKTIIDWFRITEEQQEELSKEGEFRYPKDESLTGKRRKQVFTKEDLETRVDMNCVKDMDSWLLTIYGGKDTIVPKDSAVKYVEMPPKNEQHVIEGANHDFNGVKYMKELTDIISEFITKRGGL